MGKQWQYEPKWDGFRGLAFRDHQKINLQSKSGKPLTRYFPAALGNLKADKFVLDGEIVIPVEGDLSFDQLLMRIHPSATRVEKLSRETLSVFSVFDLLVNAEGKSLVDLPLEKRRQELDRFAFKWQPFAPKIVAEVQFDHFTGGRFQHGTKFLRWRPDKKPTECTIRQVQRENRSVLNLL